MDGLVEAPETIGPIDPAELPSTPKGKFMIGDPVAKRVFVARRGDTHQTRRRSRVLGSQAAGISSGPIEDQSKVRRSI